MGSDPGLLARKEHLVVPGHNAITLTPSDTMDLALYSRGIYVGTGGNIAVTMAGVDNVTSSVVFKNVASGTLLPLRVRRVWATNTTATDIIAVW